MGGNSTEKRDMSADCNFVYDSEGNLIEDKFLQGECSENTLVYFHCRTAVKCALRKSKSLKISYDWRGMPVEFRMETRANNVLENTRSADWERELVTHYTGIGTEVRENYRDGSLQNARVVAKSLQGERRKNKFTCFYDRAAAAYAEGVHMPQGLGRYGVEDAEKPSSGNATFEWYLKNHLGSTMMVAKVLSSNAPAEVSAAYDYRAFGEQITLSEPTDKVTENFTGIRLRGECCEHACMFIAEPMGLGAKRKERDDETALNYFGARYLDPMLGLWTSVDPARQFASPYLYAGNGVNPIGAIDDDGNELETTTLFGFSIAVGFGIMFRIDYVSNTENPG